MKTSLIRALTTPVLSGMGFFLSGCGDSSSQDRVPRKQYCSYSILASKCEDQIKPPGPVCFDCATSRSVVCGFTNGTRVIVTFASSTNECELTLRTKLGDCTDCGDGGVVATYVRAAE